MNYKNHSIFEKNNQKEDQKLFVFVNEQNMWCFEKNKKFYNLAPSNIVRMSLSPLASGADQLIKNACELKNISYKNGINVIFTEQEHINYDFKLQYDDETFDGWLYTVTSDKYKINKGQKIWVCKYLNLYYENPPSNFYLSLESV